jgi:hypothetical protein
METESILKALEKYDGTFPREALLAALEQRESITPGLLDALRFARERAHDLPDDYFLHTWAMFLLAKFREPQAYPLIVDLLSFPRKTLDQLHGGLVTEDGGRILASVCGGDTRLIEQLIENPEADEYARDAGVAALVGLVAAGQRSREDTLEYFRHLFRTAKAEPESFFWSGLVAHTSELYPDVLIEEIREAFSRDLVDPWFIDLKSIEATIRKGKDAALAALAADRHYKLIEDVIAETEWWACFQSPAAPPDVAATGIPAPPVGGSAARSTPPVLPWTESTPPPVPAPANVGPKPGRNDPCPCGSGLKYKKCCLKKH